MMGNHVIICSVWLFPSMWLPKNIVPQALAQYANWPALHECEVVWCPTAANHSGENIISFFFWKKNYLHIDNYSGKIIMKLLFMKTSGVSIIMSYCETTLCKTPHFQWIYGKLSQIYEKLKSDQMDPKSALGGPKSIARTGRSLLKNWSYTSNTHTTVYTS